MAKHPIGFRPSFPKLIILPEEPPRRKEPEPAHSVVDAIASSTLYGDEEVPYEDRNKGDDKEK